MATASELKKATNVFAQIMPKIAISPLYKVLFLSPTGISGNCGWAIVQFNIDLGIASTVAVDAQSLIAMINGLPGKEEFKITIKSEAVSWKCSNSKGHLATIPDMPAVSLTPWRAKIDAYKPSANFSVGLQLGATSCGQKALEKVGLFGAALAAEHNRIVMRSTNNVTCSECILDANYIGAGFETVTLSPESVRLLAMLCEEKNGTIEFEDKVVKFRHANVLAIINQVPPLQHDVARLCETYSDCDIVVAIPPEQISKFLRRAKTLSEIKRKFEVQLTASGQELSLLFVGQTVETEEVYLVDNVEFPDTLKVKLDGNHMAAALEHATSLILDYMDKGILIFFGANPDFRYIIARKV